MPAKVVLVTEITPIAAEIDAAAQAWRALAPPAGALDRAIFKSLDGHDLLELLAFERFEDLSSLTETWARQESALAPLLAGDWRRQVLGYVESVKPTEQPLPATPYLQLRHVEVKPPVYHDYRAWRERTIFQVVRRNAEVEVFLAYHSVVSERPGVMFLSGFSGDPDQYQKVFATEEYKTIVQEAGDTYITGGPGGLYTRLYRRIDR